MESSAIYVCLAAVVAFLIPMHPVQETFKIEIDPGIQWSSVVDTCKKPFIGLSNGVKDNIYTPTKEALAKAVPFKSYFRRRNRNKMVAKMENMRKRGNKEKMNKYSKDIGKYRRQKIDPKKKK